MASLFSGSTSSTFGVSLFSFLTTAGSGYLSDSLAEVDFEIFSKSVFLAAAPALKAFYSFVAIGFLLC
jgi:hypothetical protein